MIDVIAWIGVSALSVGLSLIALYYALKRTSYNEETLKIARESLEIKRTMLNESRKYWGGWKNRSKNIAEQNLEIIHNVQLATYVDTDGAIGLHKSGKSSFIPCIDFGNTSKSLVERFQYLWGVVGTFEERERIGNMKKLYRFRISKLEEVRKFLLKTVPYLTLKKERGRLLLEYCEIRLRNYRRRIGTREREIYNKLKILNRRGLRENHKS